MKFALAEIRKHAYDKPFKFSGDVDVSELESLNNDIRKTSPANVMGNCVIEGDEFVFTLKVRGELILPCARTLVDVNYKYSINAIEVFSASPHYGKDRKSTRLNSSHVAISYAVFCLNKKNSAHLHNDHHKYTII